MRTLSASLHETVMNGLAAIIDSEAVGVNAAERRLIGLVLGLSFSVMIVSPLSFYSSPEARTDACAVGIFSGPLSKWPLAGYSLCLSSPFDGAIPPRIPT